jgi:hypothetical protein
MLAVVDGRVVERPRGGHRFFKISTLWSLAKIVVKMETGRDH